MVPLKCLKNTISAMHLYCYAPYQQDNQSHMTLYYLKFFKELFWWSLYHYNDQEISWNYNNIELHDGVNIVCSHTRSWMNHHSLRCSVWIQEQASENNSLDSPKTGSVVTFGGHGFSISIVCKLLCFQGGIFPIFL